MKNTINGLSINDLARKAGVTPQTVRNYITEGKLVPDEVYGNHQFFAMEKVDLYIDILTGSQDSALVLRFISATDSETPTDEELTAYIKAKGFEYDARTAFADRDDSFQDALDEYVNSDTYKLDVANAVYVAKEDQREELIKRIEGYKAMMQDMFDKDTRVINAKFVLNSIDVQRDITDYRKVFKIDDSVGNSDAREQIKEQINNIFALVNKEITKRFSVSYSKASNELKSLDDYYADGSSSAVPAGKGYLKVSREVLNEFKKKLERTKIQLRRAKRFVITDVKDISTLDAALLGIFSKRYNTVVVAGSYENDILKSMFKMVDASGLARVYLYED